MSYCYNPQITLAEKNLKRGVLGFEQHRGRRGTGRIVVWGLTSFIPWMCAADSVRRHSDGSRCHCARHFLCGCRVGGRISPGTMPARPLLNCTAMIFSSSAMSGTPRLFQKSSHCREELISELLPISGILDTPKAEFDPAHGPRRSGPSGKGGRKAPIARPA